MQRLFLLLSTGLVVFSLKAEMHPDPWTGALQKPASSLVTYAALCEPVREPSPAESASSENLNEQARFDTAALSGFNRFFLQATEPHKARTIGVAATISGLYAGASVALYNYWYRDYDLGPFRLFNDNAEWLQMDKGGHVLSGYFQTTWSYGLFQWAGLPKHKSLAYAALTSTVIQSTIEVFDGFSQEWGFSLGDIAANTAGTGLAIGQQALWDEQRISLKFSFAPVNYGALNDAQLEQRSLELYGSAFAERLLKDYNGLTYWLSVNPASFAPGNTWLPAWLNVALGYGAEGLYGGFGNEWCSQDGLKPENCPEALLISRQDVARQRQYLLSFDVDFTKIPTRKPFLRSLFGVINLIKVPAPALEIRQGEGFKAHWVYL